MKKLPALVIRSSTAYTLLLNKICEACGWSSMKSKAKSDEKLSNPFNGKQLKYCAFTNAVWF